MSLSKGRTQQTVEALKQLLCGVSSQTGDIFGNMRTARAWQEGKQKKKHWVYKQHGMKRKSVQHRVKLSTRKLSPTWSFAQKHTLEEY